MVESAQPWTEVLPTLEETGQRRRDLRRLGPKVVALAKLARAGIPVPPGWVLDAQHFDAFVGRCLPQNHDLRTLVKLAGTRRGDERSARAYEELLAEPLSDHLVEALTALWDAELQQLPAGVAVRPSLAAGGSASMASRHLHSIVGARSLEELLGAIKSVWASAVLAAAVDAYAAAGLKEVSLALLIQQAVKTEHVGSLTKTVGPSEPLGGSDWHIGVPLGDAPDAPWRRRGELLLPLSLGRGGEDPPPALAALCDALAVDGYEQLLELGSEGERVLGDSAVFHFAVERHSAVEKQQGSCVVHVLGADDSPRWQPLSGGDDSTTWVEITMGGRSPAPPTRLTQSILERTARGALEAPLKQLHCKIDSDLTLVSSWAGRTYLNVNALLEASRDAPLLSPEDVLAGVGGVGPERRRALAGRSAAHGRSMWRTPLVGVTAVREQLGRERALRGIARAIEHDSRGLEDMDLSVLPSDAMGVTLASAQGLLERTTELWAECALNQLVHAVGLRTLVRRRLPDADPRLGFSLLAGSGRSFASTMTAKLEQVVQVFRRDTEATARLDDPTVRLVADLPDGPGRGALGQFLGRYGDVAIGALELATPRWREDASDLMQMIALLLRAPPGVPADAMQQAARASADAELARYESELNALERRLLRGLLDRGRRLAQGRATVDRLLFRSLALVRKVVLDIGRRLGRIDMTIAADGAFHCSAERLMGALASGRPELARTIRMRQVERQHQSAEPAPPLCFVASPPRAGTPIVAAALLEGLGASAGVVEGRVRILSTRLPDALEPGDLLVMTSFDVALAPLCLVAGGIIAEAGGDLSLGAEAARELNVPAVTSLPNAGLRLEDGERVRLDGAAGRVQRLDYAPDARGSRMPIPTAEQAVP